jgi:hypothetical protein
MMSRRPGGFRKNFLHTAVVSTTGVAIVPIGRTQLEYRDSAGTLVVLGEEMGDRPYGFAVHVWTVPDVVGRPRSRVLAALADAFAAARWRIEFLDKGEGLALHSSGEDLTQYRPLERPAAPEA